MCAACTHSGTDARSQQWQAATPEINQFVARLIRRKARELIRHAGFNPSDREDIEQDLLLVLLKRLRKFNPRIAHYNAFVTTVVERYTATLIGYRAAEMRTPRQNGGSLNEIIDDGDGHCIELLATIVDGQQKRHTGQQIRSDEELSDLVYDVADVLADLPPRLREICERLKHGTTSEVARSMGIGRVGMYELIGRIRVRFEKADLRDYLQTFSDTWGRGPVGNK